MQQDSKDQKVIRKRTLDITGKQFGKLKVLSFSHYHKGKYEYWNCECECGTKKVIYRYNLKAGLTTSCGCTRAEVSKQCAKLNFHIFEGVQIKKAIAKSIPKNNTSGAKGVYKDKRSGKWRARIILQGKRTELGYFEHFSEAVEARKQAEEKVNQIIRMYQTSQQNKIGSDGK